MSRRLCIIAALILAVVATVAGWSQSMIYKDTPLLALALWFPLVVITRASDFFAVALSLIQFPLFAAAFALGLRRWSVARVVAALLLAYGFLAGAAVIVVKAR